jgi:hypothetical protein
VKRQRLWLMAMVVIMLMITGCSQPSVLQTSNGASGSSGTRTTVPWDYKIDEAKVGDLVGDEMVLLPNNELLTNDQNYATGDVVFVLNFMSAEMNIDSEGRNDVTLSAWKPIKTFKSKEDAAKDLADLKVEMKTEIDLVGVYKTDFEGKSRYFAVVTMPTGHNIKQPIQEDRYKSFKDKKKAQAVIEEVHDFNDYDLAMAKFRGWAE